jgi:maleate isomerase
VGVIVPYDMALDRELWRWVPDDVSVLTTRTPNRGLAVCREMAEVVGDKTDLTEGVRDLAAVAPRVYAYGCASGSFIRGLAGEEQLVETMLTAGAPAAVTASGALREAIAAFGARRVVVVTPYTADLTSCLATFLGEADIEVVGSAELGLTGGVWTVPYTTTAELVRRADVTAAEAVVVSCTNLATYDLIGPLEAELGKPIVTANQALIWAALRRIERRPAGKGQRLVDL